MAALSVALLFFEASAFADGGNGGGSASGGAGGTGFIGNAGGDGFGGGGGGGGAGGGNGGSSGAAGGRGGTALHPRGFDGANGQISPQGSGGAGAGGGGGYNGNGSGSAILTNAGQLLGGAGGNGGNGQADTNPSLFSRPKAGGGGGAGGYGAIVTGAGASSNSGTISGGNGGSGGDAAAGQFGSPQGGGNGGDGGVGVQFVTSGASFLNSGTIRGGLGGRGGIGSSGSRSQDGASGAAVVGASLTIVNSGDIEGARNAITFTGGANTLTLAGRGTIVGDIEVKGSLDFNQPTNASLFGRITGTGEVSKSGAGTLTLLGSNTYFFGTTLNAGTLAIETDQNLGWRSSQITFKGGTLKFLASMTSERPIELLSRATLDASGAVVTLAGSVTGTGGLTITGGTIVLAGAYSYSGDTTIGAGGTLQFASGRGTGSVPSTILDNGTLAFNRSDNLTYDASSIIGTGSVRKLGPNTLTFAGTGGYSGDTTVEAGILNVTGTLASSVVVRQGAVLSGNGSIGGAAIASGGFVTPGIGTLTVGGNLGFNHLSVYTVTMNATTSSKLQVGGSASLGGAVLLLTPQPGTQAVARSYTILTAAGGITGGLAGFLSASPLVTISGTRIVGNDLIVEVGAADYLRVAATPSEAAVAKVLNVADDTASGDFAVVISALSQLTSANGAALLRSISGQTYSGFGTVSVQGAQTFMNAFTQQAGGGQVGGAIALAEACDVACDATSSARWGAWGGGLGAFGTVAGDANAGGLTYNLGGFAAGLDYRFTPNLVAGVAVGYNAATLYPQGTSGLGTVGTLQAGLYGEYTVGDAYFDALAGYAHSDNRMMRQIVIPGLNLRTAWGQTTAEQFFGQLEAGYKLTVAPSFGGFVTPFARLQASTSTQAGFTETGADSLNLIVAAQTTNSLRSVFGAQLGAAIDAGWRDKLNLVLRLGWSHEFADLNRPVTAAFAGAPALNFTTQGAGAPRDGAVIGFAANTAVGDATSLYLRYDGELAGGNTNHILSAGVRYVW